MSDLMKYNRIMPRDDDSFYLWIDSMKGFRLNIKGVGNCSFNQEADVLFQIERERIIEQLEELKAKMESMYMDGYKSGSENMPMRAKGVQIAIDLLKAENK